MPLKDEFSGLITLKNGLQIAVLPFARRSRIRVALYIKKAGPHEGFVPKRKKIRPANGIKNIIVESKTGPAEFQYVPGIDHATEHMVFKGLKKQKFRTPLKILRFLRGLNTEDEGAIGAETWDTGISFYLEGSMADLQKFIEFLAEVTLRPLLTDKKPSAKRRLQREWLKEQKVILEEWGWCEDDPWLGVEEETCLRMFPRHPLGSPTLGKEEDIRAITVSDIVARHKMRFHPANMLLVVIGGGVSPATVKKMAEKYFRAPKRPIPSLHIPQPPIKRGLPAEERIAFSPFEPQKVYFAIGFPFRRPLTPQGETAKSWLTKKYSTWILKRFFGGRWTSQPFWELRERRALGYRHASTLEEFPGAGSLMYSTHLFPEGVKPAVRVVLNIFKKLATQPINPREFKDIKASLQDELDSKTEVPTDLAELINSGLRMENRVPMIDDLKKNIEVITREDVFRAAREIIVPGRLYATFKGKTLDQQTQREIMRMLKNWKLEN